MEYRYLGSSGLQVSALSYGSWVTFSDQIEESVALDCMKLAYESGVNFFDNAEAYAGGASETMMGNIIKKLDWNRSEFLVSTKIFWGGKGPNQEGLSRKHVLEGADAALARLQLDYVDLIFCHRPDPNTPIEETVRAMSYLVDQGKAFYWGTSEWESGQIQEAYNIARREHLVPPTMEQPQYNMFEREKVEADYLKLYDEIGLGTTTWSPLASGLLAGKYQGGIPDGSRMSLSKYEWLKGEFEGAEGRHKIDKVDQLMKVAGDLGYTMAQLALAWCLKNEHVSTVIMGASKPEQIKENLEALDVMNDLSDPILTDIEKILKNKPVLDINIGRSGL